MYSQCTRLPSQPPSTAVQEVEQLAKKYHVEDVSGAALPGSRISNILMHIERGMALTTSTRSYLEKQQCQALLSLVAGEIDYEEFSRLIHKEKAARKQQREREEKARQQAREKEEQRLQKAYEERRKKEVQERLRRESDPRYIAKRESNRLREAYGLIHYIEQEDFRRVMGILRTLDSEKRLSEEDFVWLCASDEYFTPIMWRRHHRTEALFYTKQYHANKDLWALVNASSHYRKAEKAEDAHALLSPVQVKQIKNKKLKSALWTTHGGVKRDMGQYENAIALGLKAHQTTPDNFRPCTLLGAIHMELGNFGEGNDWYQQAIERGFTERDMDEDLKKIFRKADKEHQESMRAFLLSQDPYRFSWAKVKPKRHRR